MEVKKLIHLSFDHIDDLGHPSIIENFIMSNSEKHKNEFRDSIVLNQPVSLNGIIFGMCLRGNTKIRIDFKEYSLSKNDIFTIFPNQIFESLEKSDDILFEYLAFAPDFLIDLPLPKDYNIVRKMSEHPILKVSPEEMQQILELHSFIVKYHSTRKELSYINKAVKGFLFVLILEIGSIYAREKVDEVMKPTSRGEEITEQFFKLLLEYHKKERAATFYADKLCITVKHLSGTLRKTTNYTVNTWITKAVVSSAKILLKSSEMTVLQISEELNFPNPSFFGRFFKQHTHMTPLQYKNS